MRDRRVRAAFVGLILAFPVLMASFAPDRARAGTGSWSTGLTLAAVEAVVLCGLLVAVQERHRLHALRTAAAATGAAVAEPRVAPSFPHITAAAARTASGAAVRPSPR